MARAGAGRGLRRFKRVEYERLAKNLSTPTRIPSRAVGHPSKPARANGYEYVIFRVSGGFALGDHRNWETFQDAYPGVVVSAIGERFVELSVPIQVLPR